eukprot:CAMPEP_0172185496 /NCGR_PEP_ID=MMETSP1050-20130122/20205_1 /TAXON_ID=233186 /ORGANISM="Cryptomonas curvata, Strain CCAP979/52" /LENGTH=120 /DNA_ID=CAMNT_0012859495 /DNA_START=32 /DNA_END=391 /DNA_ORIENTATION=-
MKVLDQQERECFRASKTDEFMTRWTSHVGDDVAYSFALEGLSFCVYELYWSVKSLGGSGNVRRWKDVGNDMMFRKAKRKVNSAPGKNYGLIKNQWERWQLSSFEDAEPQLKPPPEYDAPT